LADGTGRGAGGRPQDGLADGHYVCRSDCGRPLLSPNGVADGPANSLANGRGGEHLPRPHPTNVWTLDNLGNLRDSSTM
jgi:hypothetical protein